MQPATPRGPTTSLYRESLELAKEALVGTAKIVKYEDDVEAATRGHPKQYSRLQKYRFKNFTDNYECSC